MTKVIYYRIRRGEHEVGLYVVLFGAYFSVSLYKFLNAEMAAFVFFVIFYLALLISTKQVLLVLKALLLSILSLAGIIIIYSWITKNAITSNIGPVTDTQMLVFATFVYVFLTYKILQSNREIFEYSRLPQLSIGENFPFLGISNKSEFIAKNIDISAEIVGPVPETLVGGIGLWVYRVFKRGISNLKKSNLDFMPSYFIERLEPEETRWIDIRENVLKVLPLKIDSNSKYFFSDTELNFDIIVSYTYKSGENFPIPEPIFRLFRCKSGKSGYELIKKTGDVIKIR